MTTSGENREATALAEQLTTNEQPVQQPDQVPVHVVQAMREELKALKEKNDAFSNHIQMMQWQQPTQQPVQQPVYDPFQGKDPKDSILVEDAQRLFGDFTNQVKNEIRSQIGEIKMATRASDYKDVINKYLPKAAQEDPEILQEIKSSSDPYKLAYLYAKSSKAYQEDQFSQRSQQSPNKLDSKSSQDLDRIINNAKQSGSLASVGNQSNTAGQFPSYSRMSDDEFKAYKASLKFKAVGRG